MKRITGNYGVSALGVAGEKPEKSRRTRPTNIVLGPVILGMLDEVCRLSGRTRSSAVRTMVMRAAAESCVVLPAGAPTREAMQLGLFAREVRVDTAAAADDDDDDDAAAADDDDDDAAAAAADNDASMMQWATGAALRIARTHVAAVAQVAGMPQETGVRLAPTLMTSALLHGPLPPMADIEKAVRIIDNMLGGWPETNEPDAEDRKYAGKGRWRR